MDRSAYLDSLWALLPRAHRAEFHAQIMADPNNDYFRDGPYDSRAGAYFEVAVGSELYVDIALKPISEILQGLVDAGSLAADQLPDFRDLIIANLQMMLNDLGIDYPAAPAAPAAPAGGRHGYKNTRKHNRKNHRSRKNRKHSRKGRK